MPKISSRATAHNGTSTFMKRFKVPFHLNETFIDTEDMSKNYADGLIPIVDLADATTAVIGPWRGRINQAFKMSNLTPRFELVPKDRVYSHPAFNRDTSPGHCLKLENDWLDQFATAGLGLKLPETYGGIVLNCDSTHTGVNRIRKGVTELPFWLADVPDQGDRDSTLKYALHVAGHLFLCVNVINKRGCDIFDQHKIKVACKIHPAYIIDAKISQTNTFVKRGGAKMPNAIHNLNEVYDTFKLDEHSSQPGTLLVTVLNWFTRNWRRQSVDGCLCTSFAMVLKENAECGITWDQQQMDQVASVLRSKFGNAREAQLAIKAACLPNKNPGTNLHSNHMVSNGIKWLAAEAGIPVSPALITEWDFK